MLNRYKIEIKVRDERSLPPQSPTARKFKANVTLRDTMKEKIIPAFILDYFVSEWNQLFCDDFCFWFVFLFDDTKDLAHTFAENYRIITKIM